MLELSLNLIQLPQFGKRKIFLDLVSLGAVCLLRDDRVVARGTVAS